MQYKLEDFGEIVGWTKDGKPFMAYRDNKKTDTLQEQLSFEDTVRQLTKQYPNDMELGGKIRIKPFLKIFIRVCLLHNLLTSIFHLSLKSRARCDPSL